MRSLSGSALAKIAEQYGNEPITILDISWTGDTVTQYADRDINTIKGKILEISNLDAIININQTADSQSLAVVLDDTDGTIKNLIDQYDLHKRDVWVYQYFEGLDIGDRFLLFKGKVNSPIIWNEGDRTVSITILSQLESNEIGFSPEEGQFEDLPGDLIGEPWPMCFGTVIQSKTVRLTDRYRGTLADGFGFADPHLFVRAQALKTISEYVAYAFTSYADNQHYQQYLRCLDTYNEQKATERHFVKIFNGESFPRGNIKIKVGEAGIVGKFTGDTFHLDSYNWPEARRWVPGVIFPYGHDTWHLPDIPNNCCKKIRPHADGFKVRTPWKSWFVPTGQVLGENCGYFYASPGSTIQLWTAEPQMYVVSIVPGTVLKVTAWAQKEGQRFLQDVPSNLYSVETKTFGSISAVIITLNDALSKYKDMGWEDDIYVTFKSDVGPNTVEILEYLIDLYTDFTVDATSFANVKSKVTNYPSDFAIYDRKNILNVLQEIAWQARCSIYLKNDVFYLQYLAEEQPSVDTITEEDIIQNSFELLHTETENIITKMICEWTVSGIQTKPNKIILRHNTVKYGIHEQDYDYYIYNYSDVIVKSASFWLSRYANTWKRVRFRTPLTKLNIETLDYITLDFDGLIADELVLAKVEKADYDSETHSIIFECWCPVKAGTMVVYDFAYPAGQPEYWFFPTEEEFQEGFWASTQPGRDAVGDATRWTRGGFSGTGTKWPREEDDPYKNKENDNTEHSKKGEPDEDRRGTDRSGTKPSDIGDEWPGEITVPSTPQLGEDSPGPDSPEEDTPVILSGDAGSPPDTENPPEPPEEAEPPTNGEFDPSDLPDPDDIDFDEMNCAVAVCVSWLVPVSAVITTGGSVSWEEGMQGKRLTGTVEECIEIVVFDSCASACAYINSFRDYMENCYTATVGEPFPYSVAINTDYNTDQAIQCHSNCVAGTPEVVDIDCEGSSNPYGMVGYRGGDNQSYEGYNGHMTD